MTRFLTGLIVCAVSCAVAAASLGATATTTEAAANAPISIDSAPHPIRLACVGDSITAGTGTTRRKLTSWDGVLGRMLGEQWKVGNFGSGGRTLLQHGDFPYQTKGAMKQALAFMPDVVIIMLGTNDTKPQNWVHKDEFIADYKDLIEHFRALATPPRIFICTAPFVPGAGNYGINEAGVVEQMPMIRQIAKDEGVGLIDVHAATVDAAQDYPDRVHPNNAGAIVIARAVYQRLTGNVYDGDPPPPPPPPATLPATTPTRS